MSKTIRRGIQRTLAAVLLLQAGWVTAGVLYTWVDAEGNKHISDRPPLAETYGTKRDLTKKQTGTAPGNKLFAPVAASAASSAASAAKLQPS